MPQKLKLRIDQVENGFVITHMDEQYQPISSTVFESPLKSSKYIKEQIMLAVANELETSEDE